MTMTETTHLHETRIQEIMGIETVEHKYDTYVGNISDAVNVKQMNQKIMKKTPGRKKLNDVKKTRPSNQPSIRDMMVSQLTKKNRHPGDENNQGLYKETRIKQEIIEGNNGIDRQNSEPYQICDTTGRRTKPPVRS